jgi:AmiR/NasT family two-component response regulator
MTWRAGALPSEVMNLDIVVAIARDENCDLLMRELQRARGRVRHLWPVPERMPEDTDVIYCDLVPGLPNRLPWIPGAPGAALVLTIPVAPPPDLELLRNCSPDALLHRPFATHAVLASLVLAWTRFKYEQRLRGRIDKLDETLRTIHSVERAKAILMAKESISEEDAYHYMRRQAMTRRVSISAVAAAIVDSHEVLG